jgi:rod shape-determining protein MreD
VFLFLLFLAIVQTTLGSLVSLFGVAPELVLIAVVCCGLLRGSQHGAVWGALGGLSLDLLSGAPAVMHMIVLAGIGVVAGLGHLSPFQSRFVLPLVMITTATLLYDAASALILWLASWPIVVTNAVTQVVVPSLITNAVVMLVVFWLLVWLFEQRAELPSRW